MDSMTLTVIGILAIYVLMFFGHLEATRAMIAAGPDTLSSREADAVGYTGQGGTSIPALNRNGNLIYTGNSTNPPIFNVEGDQIYHGSFSGIPVLTISNGKVYEGNSTGRPPVATIIGSNVYRGNGAEGIVIGHSPESDEALLALIGWRARWES